MFFLNFQSLRFLRHSRLLEGLIYLLIGTAYLVRAWQIFSFNPMQHLWSDPLRHWTHASETLHPGPMAFFDPILYQLWLSVIQKLTLGLPGLIAVQATALSFATPWLWYRALREILTSKRLCLFGWAALAWSPSWLVIFSYFMTETLFLPFLGLSLWMTFRAHRKTTAGAFNLAVLCWSMTVLTRGIAAPMAGMALLFVWIHSPDKIRSALSSILILALLFLPMAYRNHHAVGMWSPLGNAWLNSIYAGSGKSEIRLDLQFHGAQWFYGFGSPSVGEKPFDPLSDWTTKRRGVANISVDLANGEKDWADAQTRNSLADTLWLRCENMIYLFWGASWPDNDPNQLLAGVQIMQRWLWAPLFIFTFIWSMMNWKSARKRPVVPSLLFIWILFQGVSLITVNEGRYRKPGEGLVVVQLLLLIDSRLRNVNNKHSTKEP